MLKVKNHNHTFSMDNIDIRKIFGKNVKHYRKELGLSQEQLAEKLDISTNHLSVIETGTKFVTYKLLEKIIEVFDVKPSSLFFVQGTAQNDDNIENKVNLIIREELGKAADSIQERIKEETDN